jgi:DNA repair exonuclease SbcCD nuclease subunit
MKFLAASDLHLASKAPASRTDTDYPEELFELLDQLRQVAYKIEAKAILLPGDLFHVRARCTWEMVARFGRWCLELKRHGVEVLSIPGNHDLLFNRYETLPTTPLGLLYEMGALTNCSTTRGCGPTVFYEDKETAVVLGVPFPDAFDLAQWGTLRAATLAGHYTIVMGHCFANQSHGEYFGEPVFAYQELLDASGADVLVLGHDHTDRGVGQVYGKWVVDLGAMARGSIADEDVNRVLKFAVIDTTANTVKQYRYDFKPAAEIFDLEKKAQREEEHEAIKDFVTKLQADLLDGAGSFEEAVSAMGLIDAVRARVLSYIESVELAQEQV